MGRRSFSGTARHCTADDDKGGAGFSDTVVVLPAPASLPVRLRGTETQALHVFRPKELTTPHALPPADIAHHARRLVVSIKHRFAPRSIVLRPHARLYEALEIRLHRSKPQPAVPARAVPSSIQFKRQCRTTGPAPNDCIRECRRPSAPVDTQPMCGPLDPGRDAGYLASGMPPIGSDSAARRALGDFKGADGVNRSAS